MRSLLTLLILLSASFANAQVTVPVEPEYTITILVVDPTGKTEFSQSALLPESLMAAMVAACETVAKANNLGTVNPDYDPMKPDTETNQSRLSFRGSAAIAAAVHKWLGAITVATAADVQKEVARVKAVEETERKLGNVKIRDNNKTAR